MVWNGFCAMKEHSKVIFCWLHFFHLTSIGVETKISNFLKKIFKIFSSPKMVWNGFCAMKEHQKWFFVDFTLFTYEVWGSKHTKISLFFWKNISNIFWSPKMAWNGFFAMKELSKMIFVDFILFNQIGHEKLSFWSSLKEVKEQSEAVFVDNTFANVQCDVESLALFFYIHV